MSIAAPISKISHPFLTEADQAVIKSTVAEINRSGRFHLDSDGLPPYAAQKIVSVLDSLADGQDVSIIPAQAEVSVAQAARFLGLPESSVHRLIRHMLVEYRQEGDQYWIDRDSLLKHDAECRRMHEGVDKIVRLSEEMGLYDD